MQLENGKIVEGKVTGITKFGAFVDLGEGKTGMVHISEVAPTFVKEISDFLTQGQTVKVKILNIAPDGKISLSVKQALDPAPQEKRPSRPRGTARAEPPARSGTAARPAPRGTGNGTGTIPPGSPAARTSRICSRGLWPAAMRRFPTSSATPTASAAPSGAAAAAESSRDKGTSKSAWRFCRALFSVKFAPLGQVKLAFGQ